MSKIATKTRRPRKMASEPPRVALLIETSNAYARGLLRGVHRFVQEHGPWSIYLPEQGRGDSPARWLKDWKGNGIIARIENRRIADLVKASDAPVIDVSAARLLPDLPWVETDDESIADFAAAHLLDRGLRNFAYCGDDAFNWSAWRRDRFVSKIEQAGHACQLFSMPNSRPNLSRRSIEANLRRWIKALPKPVGIMACYDAMGREVLDVCRQLKLRVPDDVAVVGVDNDELLCNLSDPPLSSVEPNAFESGYEAAALLDVLMGGGDVPAGKAVRVAPLGVVARRSTDVYAVGDPMVAAAMQMIRQRACSGINVDDLLAALSVTRRVLDYRFRKAAGRTPHDEIRRIRLERVSELLLQTDLTLARIAERTGFNHVEYLSAAFKKDRGISPTEFRSRGRFERSPKP